MPDSLHALLAARLDVLDPDVRRLVADAAVLGSTFPAEALIAVSGQDESAVRTALAELVRREVLTISAEPLSPERGSYGFAQNMLRQVAYDTLSRRDRKARHLTVASRTCAPRSPATEKRSPTSSPATTWTRWTLSAMTRTPIISAARPSPR